MLVCNIEGCKHAKLSRTKKLHFYYYHKEDYKLRYNGQKISLTRRPDGKVGCACGQEQHARYNYQKVYEMCRKKIHPPANSTQWKDSDDNLISSGPTRTGPDTSMRVSKRLLPRRVQGAAGQAKFESEIKLTNLEKHKDDLLREVQVTREELVAKHNELQIILKKQEISELEAELNANKLRIGSMDRLFEP
ncbi:uncharacterized protein C8R40DRAFT_871318 [Lentinula edodes]|uniref:uncharacterized protein n=1 Tax=Lentinula edodes TaxID=5353 RepID=UPI001E8EC083|nr:uncharacterized protein C8R40DRAFT_871318 [Lentinula edodes]KAH7877864.1 hypothetical protein C8R40DRAFT_871318 [Lentinula edodes]